MLIRPQFLIPTTLKKSSDWGDPTVCSICGQELTYSMGFRPTLICPNSGNHRYWAASKELKEEYDDDFFPFV